MSTKKFWSTSEDKFFLKMVNTVVGDKSGTLNEAFEIVSKKLGRTPSGCQARYKNTIKNRVTQEILDKISTNNPKNASLKSQTSLETNNQDFNEVDEEVVDGNEEVDAIFNGDDEVNEVVEGDDEFIELVDEVDEVDEDDELFEIVNDYEDGFSDIQSLVSELIKLDARRKIIKERVKKYQEFISGVLSDT